MRGAVKEADCRWRGREAGEGGGGHSEHQRREQAAGRETGWERQPHQLSLVYSTSAHLDTPRRTQWRHGSATPPAHLQRRQRGHPRPQLQLVRPLDAEVAQAGAHQCEGGHKI